MDWKDEKKETVVLVETSTAEMTLKSLGIEVFISVVPNRHNEIVYNADFYFNNENTEFEDYGLQISGGGFKSIEKAKQEVLEHIYRLFYKATSDIGEKIGAYLYDERECSITYED